MTQDAQKPLAHFFWEGKLTNFQLLSFKSAYDAGFKVIVWSLTPHELPEYATSMDVRQVLDQATLDLIDGTEQQHFFGNTEDLKRHAAISLYSDFFRVKVLSEQGGWWFDADVVSLKTANEFEELKQNRDIVVAKEENWASRPLSINATVMSFTNKSLGNKCWDSLIQSLTDNPSEVPWAFFGPEFITQFVITNNLLEQVLPQHLVHPVSFLYSKKLYSVKDSDKEYLYKITGDSYALHWWNSAQHSKSHPTNPPEGSFFYELFKKHGLSD